MGPGEASNDVTSWLHFYGKVRADQTKGEVDVRVKTEWGRGKERGVLGSAGELTFGCIDDISRYGPVGQESCLCARDGHLAPSVAQYLEPCGQIPSQDKCI